MWDPRRRMFTLNRSRSSFNRLHLLSTTPPPNLAIQSSNINRQILSWSLWLWKLASRDERPPPPRPPHVHQQRRSHAESADESRRRNRVIAAVAASSTSLIDPMTSPCITIRHKTAGQSWHKSKEGGLNEISCHFVEIKLFNTQKTFAWGSFVLSFSKMPRFHGHSLLLASSCLERWALQKAFFKNILLKWH